MKTKVKNYNEVSGTYSGYDGNMVIEWYSPFNGQLFDCHGEFYYNEFTQAYEHDVYSIDDEYLYTVVAKNKTK